MLQDSAKAAAHRVRPLPALGDLIQFSSGMASNCLMTRSQSRDGAASRAASVVGPFTKAQEGVDQSWSSSWAPTRHKACTQSQGDLAVDHSHRLAADLRPPGVVEDADVDAAVAADGRSLARDILAPGSV